MAGTRLPQDEVEARVKQCYDLRYNNSETFGVKEWLKYCHETYGDKSEQTYTLYWAQAGEKYQEHWKELLNKQLTPAVLTLIELMGSDDEKIRQRAVDQVMRYTGQDVDRQEIDVTIKEIDTQWG